MSAAVPASMVRAVLRASRPVLASPRLPLGVKRPLVDAFTGAVRAPRGTTFTRSRIAAVEVEWVRPPRTDGPGVLLYLHGGGYALGSARGYRGVAARLAAAVGQTAIVADYRLAPEHPYPAAVDDALAVYVALLHDLDEPARIALVGDSAGGGLTLAVLMALRDRNLPQPACAGLICPWLDLAADLDGPRAPTRDPLLMPSMTEQWARWYAGMADPRSPQISPLHGELSGLAPLVVHSAGDDLLAADAQRLAERIAALPEATLEHRPYPGRWHDFHLQATLLADARIALGDMATALKRHLDAAALRGEALPSCA